MILRFSAVNSALAVLWPQADYSTGAAASATSALSVRGKLPETPNIDWCKYPLHENLKKLFEIKFEKKVFLFLSLIDSKCPIYSEY